MKITSEEPLFVLRATHKQQFGRPSEYYSIYEIADKLYYRDLQYKNRNIITFNGEWNYESWNFDIITMGEYFLEKL